MMYYVVVSIKRYGAEDGLNLAARSALAPGINLGNDIQFYFVVLLAFVACVYLMHRLVRARFGRVVEAIRDNETRMAAIGFPTYRYKLICFAIAGAAAGLAGALAANQGRFVSPGILDWVQSGQLMIMVILGGVGRLYGGAIGAAVLLILEEIIAARTIYWQLPIGFILLAIVLFAPQGLAGLFGRRSPAKNG